MRSGGDKRIGFDVDLSADLVHRFGHMVVTSDVFG